MKTINSFRSKLFALALALMASVSSFAYEFVFVNDFHIDGFAYKIIDRTEPCAVALIEVADCEKHVAIPESVAYNDTTFVVTTLGMGDIVFTGIAQKTMESLYIPKTIMIVNYHALGGCPNLMSIVVDEENKYLDSRNNCNAIISSDDTYRPANHLVAGCKTTVIPNSVTEIGNYAFVRCETLENIRIPEGVTIINDGAFYECSSLSSIKLPESLIKLPQEWIFSGCTSLKEVFFFAKTPPCIAYGMFHGINPTIYVPKESLDAYENVLCWRYFDIQAIPDSMYFADDHFVKDSIHYHILNDTVAPFEVEVTYTFGSLSNMTQKNYPELTEVNIPAFVEYKGHTYIVTRIGELAFNCAQKLQRVTMGENIKTIDRFAIMNCPQLKEVQIGENVDSILLDAFGFGKLQQLSIPKNVKYIAPLIVRKNPITSINVHPENSNYTSIDGVLFNKNENILHTFPAAYATRYTIPESVDTIGSCAFAGTSIESVIFPKNLVCIANEAFTGTNLTELILPASLQSIGMTAFDMCSGITEVTCRATTPPIMSDGQEEYNKSVFLRVPIANATLYVPIESVKAYKSANQWKDFGQILPITWSEECEEYKHVNMSVVVFGKSSIIFDLSNNGTIDPPYVDSIWIVNTDQEPLRKLYAQSRDTIDISFLEERGTYILRVYIDGCRKSSTFVYRPIQNKWKDIWCDTWNVMWFDGWRFDETASTSQYRLGKDTVIGDYTYSKFTSRTSVRFTDDRKVYVYYEGFDDNDPYTVDLPTGEYLAYDFSAQVGDTLEVFSGVHSYSKYKCLVREVQTDPETKLRTITLFQLLLEDTDGDGVEEEYGLGEITWIEGVGSPNGFLINTPPPGGGTFALLCAYKGDDLKYTGSLYDEYGCEYNANDPHLPLVDWCNQWNILAHGYQGPQDPLVAACTSIFWLSNNTVNRDGQEYIPLMCSSSKPDVESTNLIGELRFTEDKQVYFYYDNTEYLLYDFDVQVGDTLDIFGGIELYSYSFVEQKTYPHVITKIDTLDDGRLQITSDAIVIFEDGEVGTFEEKQQQIWIEGLGSINGIVHTGINPGIDGNPAIVMLCAYRDDECVYKTDSNDPYWIDYTQLGCVYNDGDFIEDAFPMLSGLQRTICNEYCEDSKTSLQKFEEILFEHDKPYIYCESAFLIREENNKILIYSHSLDKDLVLYDFTLEVGDSLPRLYLDESAEKDLYWIYYNIMNVVDYHKDLEGNILPADTLIVTDVSTITLLDGKEHKKWTFNNGMEYVEGIGSYGNSMWFCDFFQLIGNMSFPVSLHGTHLVCVSKNNKLLYQMDDAEMERLGAECLCEYDRGPRKDNAKDGQIGGRPTPTQWNQLELDLRKMENGNTILYAETFSYTLENDSVVANGKTFYQLARQSTKDTATTKSFVGALHFGKDEDNRVYFLRDGVEYVLYDFTAEPGDTVEIFAGINNYPQDSTYTHVVVDKDTTENGACRMFLEVVFPEETTTATNAEKVWLAGLGSIDGIVHNTATRTSNAHAAPARSAHSSDTQTSVMLCAWRDDNCLYTTDHPDYDTLGCVYNIDEMTAIEDIHTFPSYQKLLRDGQLFIIHEGKTYNVMGIAVE